MTITNTVAWNVIQDYIDGQDDLTDAQCEAVDRLATYFGCRKSNVNAAEVSPAEATPYRGALEICKEYVAARQACEEALRRAGDLDDELRALTGKGCEAFMNDMRRLLAPADS
jgi:hypothetical protein